MKRSEIRILVACEFSGTVRDALIAKGYNATSCDIEPSESPGPHYTGDVRDILYESWNLVIAHPPCSHLASAGAMFYERKRIAGLQQDAVEFFLAFTRLSCPWAIENPVGIMSTLYRKPDQYIQPYEYGDPHQKKTCLWLNDLPPLKPTHNLKSEVVYYVDPGGVKTDYAQSSSPRSVRAKERSRTYPGIAQAMATQWGQYLMIKHKET